MTERTALWLLAGFMMLIALAVTAFGISGTRTVRIDEVEIQKRIDTQLPREFKGVTLTKATAHLDGGEVHLALSLSGNALGQQFTLEATGVGVPEYCQEDAAFYFRPTKLAVSKLELQGESATDRAGKFIDRYVTDPKLKERLVKSLPGVKRWIEDNLEPRALATLGSTPLYRPKNDMKGIIIRATLESVKVEDGALVLSFSLWELTKTVVGAVVILVIAIGLTAALLLNPELGAGIVLFGSIFG